MTTPLDDAFPKMITAHIELANQHTETIEPGFVGAALMHAAARYNAFVSSTRFPSGAQMTGARNEHIEHYIKQYREFLEHHYDQYAANFSQYTAPVLKK